MRTFTLATLRTGAKRRSDMENRSSIEDPEWDAMLSAAYGDLCGIIASSGMRYFETSTTIVTDGIDGSFALPSNHLSTIRVDHVIPGGGGRLWPLRLLMMQELHFYAGQSGNAAGFYLSGQNLILTPTPLSGQSYSHLYIQQATDLVAADDADLIDVITPDGENFLYWATAVIALHKEESDTRLAEKEREMARGRLYEWACLRMLTENPRRIVSDDGDWGGRDPGDWR